MNRVNVLFWHAYSENQENFVAAILDPDNRLFTMARQGRHLPSALVAIAVVFVMLVF
jgi:hypothetical protein